MSLQKFGQKILANFGLELKMKAKSVYAPSERVDEIFAKIAGYTMVSRSRLSSLVDQVSYCNMFQIEGAFVECGVWKGGSVAAMAAASLQTGRSDRILHLFDAFDDICAPDPELDGPKAIAETRNFNRAAAGGLAPLKGVYDSFGGHGTIAACEEVVCNRVGYPRDQVRFHKGWFQDTVGGAAPKVGPIAILRLDGDWYESTMVCLASLYDNIVPGGILILDDYHAYDGCKRATDEFLMAKGVKAYLTTIDVAAYLVKPA